MLTMTRGGPLIDFGVKGQSQIRTSNYFSFLHDNSISFWHAMKKLHTYVYNDPWRTSIDFGVERSRSIPTLNFLPFPHNDSFLCRLQSIATHRDHFVRLSVHQSFCLSVRLSHFTKLCFAGDTCIPRNAATIF